MFSTPYLQTAQSSIHGLGAFFTRPLSAGALVGRYEGRRFSAKQLARHRWDNSLTYLFSLSNGETIDGGRGGNATRHINHSCDPNCEAVEEHDADSLVLKIYTLTSVETAAEAFIDYRLVTDETHGAADYPCFCLSLGCRGTLIGPR